MKTTTPHDGNRLLHDTGLFQKRSKQGILFSKNHLEFLDLSLYIEKFRRKQVFTPGNSAKLCGTTWKFQDQKPRSLEIPHEFFLNTPGNFTSFLVEPWNFHMLFLQYPWKFHDLNPPFGFFLEQRIMPLKKMFCSA